VNAGERHEVGEFSWGSYLGFLYFFPRRLYLAGLMHIILLGIAFVVILFVRSRNAEMVKWAVFPFSIIEIGLLTYYGFKANRLSWKYCKWKSPYNFISSNNVWDVFGRLAVVFRVLNVIGYVFLGRPGGVKAYPEWLIIGGIVFYAILIMLTIIRSRGPIWAVALNTLKESFSKLEVVILFLISMVFIILFNSFWHVPAVREPVLQFFEKSQEAAKIAQGRAGNLEEEGQPTGVRSDEAAFSGSGYEKTLFRLRLQVAAFLFGEFFIALICFTLSIFLVRGEIQGGVVLTVLPKPIGRGEYILGKILGGWIIAAVCFEVMAIVSLGFAIPYHGQTLDNIPNILHAMLLMPIKFGILIALITYFSLWLPEAVAGFIGLVIFIAGHMSEYLLDLATDDFAGIPILNQSFKAIHVLLPNLSWVFSTEILDPNATRFVSIGPLIEWVFWALLYFAVIATLTVSTFRKQSL